MDNHEEFEENMQDRAAMSQSWSAKEALAKFDAEWYIRTSQLGRWTDVIGDFAGEELFVLNGDSLLSAILGDPLLALGKNDGLEQADILQIPELTLILDISFQYLHARYSLERALKEFVKRNAVFEVVFFESVLTDFTDRLTYIVLKLFVPQTRDTARAKREPRNSSLHRVV